MKWFWGTGKLRFVKAILGQRFEVNSNGRGIFGENFHKDKRELHRQKG